MDECFAEQLEKLDAVLNQIPPEHRGTHFERIFESFHPQEDTRRVECALALLWAKRNAVGHSYLTYILHGSAVTGREESPSAPYLPTNEREWKMAQVVAASVVQWLGTTVGSAFLKQAFADAGGKLAYELPDTSGYEPPRR